MYAHSGPILHICCIIYMNTHLFLFLFFFIIFLKTLIFKNILKIKIRMCNIFIPRTHTFKYARVNIIYTTHFLNCFSPFNFRFSFYFFTNDLVNHWINLSSYFFDDFPKFLHQFPIILHHAIIVQLGIHHNIHTHHVLV